MAGSTSGLSRRPFTAESRVRIPDRLLNFLSTVNVVNLKYYFDMSKDIVMKECMHHGLTEYIRRKDGIYRCKKCSTDAVQRRR